MFSSATKMNWLQLQYLRSVKDVRLGLSGEQEFDFCISVTYHS